MDPEIPGDAVALLPSPRLAERRQQRVEMSVFIEVIPAKKFFLARMIKQRNYTGKCCRIDGEHLKGFLGLELTQCVDLVVDDLLPFWTPGLRPFPIIGGGPS